jgi:four helix bundle protein
MPDAEAARRPPRPPPFARETMMQRFTDLKVWQQAHALVLELYPLTSRFPSDERYGVTSQLRRAAVSVPSNIAEGSKRRSNAEYAHFLNIAESSAAETEYLLILSRDLGYLPAEAVEPFFANIAELARMLHALRSKVEQGV